jgi:hypothetical protein
MGRWRRRWRHERLLGDLTPRSGRRLGPGPAGLSCGSRNARRVLIVRAAARVVETAGGCSDGCFQARQLRADVSYKSGGDRGSRLLIRVRRSQSCRVRPGPTPLRACLRPCICNLVMTCGCCRKLRVKQRSCSRGKLFQRRPRLLDVAFKEGHTPLEHSNSLALSDGGCSAVGSPLLSSGQPRKGCIEIALQLQLLEWWRVQASTPTTTRCVTRARTRQRKRRVQPLLCPSALGSDG